MESIQDTSTHCYASGSSTPEDVETWYVIVLRIILLNRKIFSITSSECFSINAAHIPNR